MITNRIVEYVFFFGFMGVVGYLVWKMFAPFISALALAAIIVTICYPLYKWMVQKVPRKNETVAALITTILVMFVVILPVVFLISLVVGETLAVYRALGETDYSVASSLGQVEQMLTNLIPGLDVNFTEYLRQGAQWLAGNLGAIFAGTALTLFLFFIAIIASFYFFRDGQEFTKQLVIISPLPDDEDELILERLAAAVRSVATGAVLVAMIQGVLTAIGLSLFGFERAILFGFIAAFGALIPSVGTTIVFIPAIAFLLVTGAYGSALGLTIWAMFAVGLIDNLLGPYLISRGNAMHPFLILLAVLGGVAFFGPIGFIVGPVVVSLFKVLLELYSVHIAGVVE